MEVDVLCVGHACYDLAFCVSHHPGPDEKLFSERLALAGGGPAANAAVAIRRLGGSAAFLGYLGSDPFGERHAQELAEEGVETSLLVRGHAPTPLALSLVKPDGSRTVVNHSSATPKLEAALPDWPWPAARAILFDGHEPQLSPPIADEARRRGVPTVLDAGSFHEGTRTLAEVVDYLVASERFAAQATGSTDPEEALSRLAAPHPCVVVTLGERGLIWSSKGKRGRLAAYPVPCVDSTGAGDAFHGAFALGVARRMDWEDLLRFASAAGALACTRLGARQGLPSADEVAELLGRAARHPQALSSGYSSPS
ncbi:carbohydrate kinase family protein [Methylacidimicrobium sp. B4]|uniref:carbohydrate kinase family protein n=1 Tax=Methylacidimicrobium sp. B4 TaxID=2796139 RepID=UPI001A8CC529|nr:PfkB family carbohydrate kinase [Methylacidimicrobium sp. B4]QSR84833.1 carbohydrate kinase [Methylacidimicrobium sp. B4]